MADGDFLNDPAFFGILSPEDQSYVKDVMFAEPTHGLKHMPTNADMHRNQTANAAVLPLTPLSAPTLLTESSRGVCTSPYPSGVYSHTSRDSSTPSHSFSPASVKQSTAFEMKDRPTALSEALDRLTASLNADGTLPLETFEKIVKDLSGIECLQAMLLFRPNKKKGKGGRQPAKDPRLDPNMDPRKAKRIVANRQSAARSKQKQKRHVESLQLQHDTLMIQMLLCAREKEKLETDIDTIEHDARLLETELQALMEHVQHVERYLNSLKKERDAMRTAAASLDKTKP